MKTIKISILFLSILSLCSCVRLGDLNLDPVPDIAFDVTHNGLTLTFTSATPNTSNISWKTSDGGSGTGETLIHSFSEPDTYWIEMIGEYGGVMQSVSAKILVAKPAKVSMTDNTVADWDNVTYEDFQFTGKGEDDTPIVKGKVDYDANFVYYYLEMDITKTPNCAESTHIMSVRIDADDDPSTGMSTGGVGAEYLMEGNLYGDDAWYEFYKYSSSEDDWVYIEDETFYDGIIIGHYEVDGNIMKIEWAYSRKTFEINSTSYAFYEKIYDEDWEDADILYYNGSKAIHVAMDKKN